MKVYVGVGDEDFGGRCEDVESWVVTGHVSVDDLWCEVRNLDGARFVKCSRICESSSQLSIEETFY